MEQVDPNAVRQQLHRLQRHPIFKRAPRMNKLLDYLVQQTLEGRGDQLKGYTVGVEAFDKPADFDPSADASVRVEVGRLRRMLETYYAEQPEDTVLIEVPKGSYQPIFTHRETAPSGGLERLTIASVGPSVAVLPFLTVSERDSDLNALALGIREEVLSELFRYREFHVIDGSGVEVDGESSLLQFCAEQLECEFVVRGSVRKDQRRASVNVTVSDVHLNRVVWVKNYEIDLAAAGLMEATSEIAYQIAGALAAPSGVMPIAAMHKRLGKTPREWAACDCILRWHWYRLADRSSANHAALRDQVRRVIEADPMFGMGYVIHAMLLLDEVVYRLNPSDTPQNILKRALLRVDQALSGDDDNAIGHYVRGLCHYYRGDLTVSKRSFAKALECHPRNTDLIHHIGGFTYFGGDWEEGLALLERAGMRYSSAVGYRLAHLVVAYHRGESEDDMRLLFESTRIPPDLPVALLLGALIYHRIGDQAQAAEYLRRAHRAEAGLSENIAAVAGFWFADPGLRQQVIDDLQAIGEYASVVKSIT